MVYINFNDLKTIGYSFKVSANDVEDICDNLQKEDMVIDGEVITRISLKDQKQDSPKESPEDNYSTYTVIDYNEDVNYPDSGLSGVQIILSKNNTDKKMFIFYKHDFIKWSRDKKFKIKERLLDNEYIKVLF